MGKDAQAGGGGRDLRPGALSVQDLAQILSAAGGRAITADMIRSDVDAGAPTNVDGTINLVHYTAWLLSVQ